MKARGAQAINEYKFVTTEELLLCTRYIDASRATSLFEKHDGCRVVVRRSRQSPRPSTAACLERGVGRPSHLSYHIERVEPYYL